MQRHGMLGYVGWVRVSQSGYSNVGIFLYDKIQSLGLQENVDRTKVNTSSLCFAAMAEAHVEILQAQMVPCFLLSNSRTQLG